MFERFLRNTHIYPSNQHEGFSGYSDFNTQLTAAKHWTSLFPLSTSRCSMIYNKDTYKFYNDNVKECRWEIS